MQQVNLVQIKEVKCGISYFCHWQNIYYPFIGRNEIKKKTSKSPSKMVPQINDQSQIPELHINKATDWFTHEEGTDGEPKVCLKAASHNDIAVKCFIPNSEPLKSLHMFNWMRNFDWFCIFTRNVMGNGTTLSFQLKETIKRFYKSGKCFITLFPDGTGNVLYPFKKNCTKRKMKDLVKVESRYTFVPFDKRFKRCKWALIGKLSFWESSHYSVLCSSRWLHLHHLGGQGRRSEHQRHFHKQRPRHVLSSQWNHSVIITLW